MGRRIIVLFFSLFCLTASPAWADAGVAAHAVNRGALFRVTGAGHTLYLFGTMHVGLPEFYPLEPTITDAIAHATTLALEIDPLRDPAGMAKLMQETGIYAPGSVGQNAMPAALRPRVDHALRKFGMDPAAVAPFKPWLLVTMLALDEFTALGYSADLAVDSRLAQLARDDHVPVLELESASAQLALFANMSEADQWRMLADSVDSLETGKESLQARDIADAWRTADRAGLDAIAATIAGDTSFSGKFLEQVLLNGRNPALAGKIAGLLARETNTVAAIGVLHLLGKNGVPELLRQRGLTVERVY